MRLPVVGAAPDAPIDEERAAEMFAYAIDKGVNYFDTAYGYHDGQSETVTGRILSKYPRDSYYLATKFPGYDLANMAQLEDNIATYAEEKPLSDEEWKALMEVAD